MKRSILALVAMTSLVTACGSGDTAEQGTGGVPEVIPVAPRASATAINGTVARDIPLVGATVEIKDASGDLVGSVLTDTNGNYSLPIDTNLKEHTGPFFARATGTDGTVYFSIGSGASILNLTTLSDSVARSFYQALGLSAEDAFANLSGLTPLPNPQQLSGALSHLTASLEVAAGLDPSFDPIGDPFAVSASPEAINAVDGFLNTNPTFQASAQIHQGAQGVGFPGTSVTFTSNGMTTDPVEVIIVGEETPAVPRAEENSPKASPGDGGRNLVGYYSNWTVYRLYPGQKDADGARGYNIKQNPGNPSDTKNQLPADKIDLVNYAFAKIQDKDGQLTRDPLEGPKGTVVSTDPWADWQKTYPPDGWKDWHDFKSDEFRGNFLELKRLKDSKKELRSLISIGGWTLSQQFSPMAMDKTKRKLFVDSAVQFMTKYGFDGIDIDWEYPVSGNSEFPSGDPSDKKNYTLLLQELRQAMDAAGKPTGKHYLLTVAVPASPAVYANLELAEVAKVVDFMNLMAYDYHGPFDTAPPITGHMANLFAVPADPFSVKFNSDQAIKDYIAAGVPSRKIVLGVPAYGRAYAQVTAGPNFGLFQAFDPKALPVKGSFADNVFDYWDIFLNIASTQANHYDDGAVGAWAFRTLPNQPGKGNVMISYDDAAASTTNKTKYAKAKFQGDKGFDLGGVMIWDLAGDLHDSDNPNSIVKAIHDNLNN